MMRSSKSSALFDLNSLLINGVGTPHQFLKVITVSVPLRCDQLVLGIGDGGKYRSRAGAFADSGIFDGSLDQRSLVIRVVDRKVWSVKELRFGA